jgi:hypothetical protein
LRHLAALDGTLLDADATLAQTGIVDGALIRLVGLADAPPPPVVHDVVEETAEDLDRRNWQWGPAARQGLAAAVFGVGALLVAHLAAPHGPALLAAPVVLLLAGTAAGRMLPPPFGLAFLLAGAATGADAALRLGTGGLGVGIVAALFLLGAPFGRGALVAGATGLGLVVGWTAALRVGVDPPLAAAGVAVVSIGVLGVLPRFALLTSGLTALDDRRSREAEVGRQDVTVALTDAHRGLALAAMAAAVTAGAAGSLLALRPTGWTGSLAVLIAVVLVLRARSFPLAGPVVTLAVAAGAIGVGLIGGWRGADPASAATAVGVVTLGAFGALVLDPPDHVRARVRRLADRLELIAVVACVPTALGVSGLYGHLLRAF